MAPGKYAMRLKSEGGGSSNKNWTRGVFGKNMLQAPDDKASGWEKSHQLIGGYAAGDQSPYIPPKRKPFIPNISRNDYIPWSFTERVGYW